MLSPASQRFHSERNEESHAAELPVLRWGVHAALAGILILYAAMSCTGITWGLPSRAIDGYLFGGAPPWPGEKIYRLAQADRKFSKDRGADVDADPLIKFPEFPFPKMLTATPEDIAKIYLRYRLYSYQPDEMITMMALAGMSPGGFNFDPRLYQYGGLFIYPVGALIKLCGWLGLIDVRNDVIHYLDHPDEFGKFYVVARAYSAAWGLLGVLTVYAIARHLVGRGAGLMAALLFALLPVVVCMSHEAKPHLPGAALMLLAVMMAMRHLAQRWSDTASHHWWWLMCGCCGAALGMVLSSWPIFVLVPLAAWREHVDDRRRDAGAQLPRTRSHSTARSIMRTLAGISLGIAVYVITNPYILINALTNREVLRSNFGNSLAMYEIARVGEGLTRALELTREGGTLPIMGVGILVLVIGLTSRDRAAWLLLAVPAAVFFVQFVLIGAGKPAEYGRFGVFTNSALAIGAACVMSREVTKAGRILNAVFAICIILCPGVRGEMYLHNFRADTTSAGSRLALAAMIQEELRSSAGPLRIALIAEPAPYSCPPLDFARSNVVLLQSPDQLETLTPVLDSYYLETVGDRREFVRSQAPRFSHKPLDELGEGPVMVIGGWRRASWYPAGDTPISWANKSFLVAGF